MLRAGHNKAAFWLAYPWGVLNRRFVLSSQWVSRWASQACLLCEGSLHCAFGMEYRRKTRHRFLTMPSRQILCRMAGFRDIFPGQAGVCPSYQSVASPLASTAAVASLASGRGGGGGWRKTLGQRRHHLHPPQQSRYSRPERGHGTGGKLLHPEQSADQDGDPGDDGLEHGGLLAGFNR
ncbi:Hypothetical protein GbCGDNIH1_1621 [Granulibacter bethesdensis CGDNIH1]|uniref:Uncharacterized protein n=1 Tax=Granulibacter bethesdensis (strain ATCC BAA-1260 / CGDNIH1) TaxID=391165 RepID=Q0BRN4_GRABC|nr:Hypothetical protein GbCGDNIH1_1621 [Granulibacter bethesdensis CGDNIH1]APH52360.1 Hypothetical protein GbCGDNIH5_1621 [Granulibacter bethesdensis]APH65054.1 Hypothetical protein GbCGDNIH1I4_1621 [Granulibacter bethesdensis]